MEPKALLVEAMKSFLSGLFNRSRKGFKSERGSACIFLAFHQQPASRRVGLDWIGLDLNGFDRLEASEWRAGEE